MSTPPATARTFLLGGEFHADNRQTIGSMVISQLKSFRAHHAVLTIGALDARTGVMDYSIEEAQLARGMIEQAEGGTEGAQITAVKPVACQWRNKERTKVGHGNNEVKTTNKTHGP